MIPTRPLPSSSCCYILLEQGRSSISDPTKLIASAAATVMRANSSFDLEPHGAKRLCRRQASVIGRAQQCLGGVKVDAQHMALSNDLPTRCPNLYHMGRGGAGEQQVFGGHGPLKCLQIDLLLLTHVQVIDF